MIFHLSPIAMRLSRYAGATPGTGCCGESSWRTSTGRAPALYSSSAPPPLTVGPATSGADDSGGVTGGVYKARERIHRGMLIRDY